jgi:hypothetical protein
MYSVQMPLGSVKQSMIADDGRFTALKSNIGDSGRYPELLAAAGFTPVSGRRFAIFYRDEVIQPDPCPK